MGKPIVRAAVAQAEPAWLDVKAGVDKTVELIAQAARQGAEIVAFPETFIPGYPVWIWHGSFAYSSNFVRQYMANSIERTGPEIRRIAEAARLHRIVVVIGFAEYDRGSLYMAQATISERGELVSVRRKLKPTHIERSIFGDGGGEDLKVHSLSIGRVGALNCWEHIQPLNKYALFSMGEQIHVASWPQTSAHAGAQSFGVEVTNSVNRVYAVEGQVFVLESHSILGNKALELFGLDEENKKYMKYGGGNSRVWGPDGSMLGTPLREDEEGVLVADLHFDEIDAARAAADPIGHYARTDVFQVTINQAAQSHALLVKGSPRQNGTHQKNGLPTTAYTDLLAASNTSDLEIQETDG